MVYYLCQAYIAIARPGHNDDGNKKNNIHRSSLGDCQPHGWFRMRGYSNMDVDNSMRQQVCVSRHYTYIYIYK